MTLNQIGNADEDIRNIVDALITDGNNITTTFDSANESLTLDTAALNTEEVQDTVDSLITDGNNITATYDDTTGALTLDTAALNTEEVQDTVDSLITDGNNITATYDDTTGALTLDTAALNTEEVEAAVDALITDGNNITTTFDSANNSLTLDTAALNSEEVEDAVNALLTAGSNTSFSYDDAAGELLVDVSNRTDAEIQSFVDTHSNSTSDVHGVASTDTVAGQTDITSEINTHANQGSIHHAPSPVAADGSDFRTSQVRVILNQNETFNILRNRDPQDILTGLVINGDEDDYRLTIDGNDRTGLFMDLNNNLSALDNDLGIAPIPAVLGVSNFVVERTAINSGQVFISLATKQA